MKRFLLSSRWKTWPWVVRIDGSWGNNKRGVSFNLLELRELHAVEQSAAMRPDCANCNSNRYYMRRKILIVALPCQVLANTSKSGCHSLQTDNTPTPAHAMHVSRDLRPNG